MLDLDKPSSTLPLLPRRFQERIIALLSSNIYYYRALYRMNTPVGLGICWEH